MEPWHVAFALLTLCLGMLGWFGGRALMVMGQRLRDSDKREQTSHDALMARLMSSDTQVQNAFGALNQSVLAREGQLEQMIAAAKTEAQAQARAEVGRMQLELDRQQLQRDRQTLDSERAVPEFQMPAFSMSPHIDPTTYTSTAPTTPQTEDSPVPG